MEEIGKFVWIEDDTYSWLPAKIIDVHGNNYKFLMKIDGELIEKLLPKDAEYSEVHTSCLNGVDDLLLLGDFNHQTLLHNTRVRFADNRIYTFIGMPILIAVNPYKSLPLYTETHIEFYKKYFLKLKINPNDISPAVPHLYHIAEAAYQDMIIDKKNQSIIISGESGSGKTESTKIILRYLAVSSLHSGTNPKQNKNDKDTITVEKQVLDSNPLLEAFGNAKTVKNNNSSRFGKFIQVNFTDHGKIVSAKIYNYLLEKSRVVKIQPEERNYHIFYQLILGADEKERQKYYIKDLEYFEYLNKGVFHVEDNDDVANFNEMKQCMLKLKFKPEEMAYIFNVLMGILYLGNVNFVEGISNNNPIAQIDESNSEDFKIASELLGIEISTFNNILTIRKMKDPMSNKVFDRNLSVEKAYRCRDAISKAVYARMFDFIVKRINSAIANADEAKIEKDKMKKIGLLDIFGFENFELNSFEQLCINYANERLQQYFNNHIFKLEQEEYKREGIDWSTVEFQDNKDIIDLIDDSKLSIFSILDSEGIVPNGDDYSFHSKVYSHLIKNPYLGEKSDDYISIDHYAGSVYYYVGEFLEKNLDQLTPDIQEALEKSKNKLIKKVFERKEEEIVKKKSSVKSSNTSNNMNKLQSDSISKQFKKQLDDLLKMLSQSNPRYVKCIKPNSLKKPLILESFDVMDQLTSAGVLEAIRIRKAGYSIRRTQEEFLKRYHPLVPHIDLKYYDEKKEYKEPVMEMLNILKGVEELKYYLDNQKKLLQVGLNKIFMKEEVKTILEYKLNRIKYIFKIQAKFRGWKVYKRVRKILKDIRLIQAHFRGFIFRKNLLKLKNSIKIQRFFRFSKMRRIIFKTMKRKANEIRMEKKRLLEEERARLSETNSLNQNINKIPKYDRDEEDINMLKRSFKDKTEKERHPSEDEEDTTDKKVKKSKKNKISNMLQTDFNSILGGELKSSLEELKNQLEQTRIEKDKLQSELNNKKEEINIKNQEIDLLKTKEFNQNINKTEFNINTFFTAEEKEEYIEEIKKFKQEVLDKDGNIDILNLKIEELTKANKDLLFWNESLKDQLQKRKAKMDTEMTSLYNQIKELEIKKLEYERNQRNDNYKSNSSNDESSHKIVELKMENKNLNKKIDEIKSKYEKELLNIKNEIFMKENKIRELELQLVKNEKELRDKTDSYNNLKNEYEMIKREIETMKFKVDVVNKNSNDCEGELNKMKNEFDNIIKKKDLEIKELKSNQDVNIQLVERGKKMEKALKNEINIKDDELQKRQEMIADIRMENDKLIDEIMILKKETYNLQSKLDIIEADYKNRNENDNKFKNQEYKALKEKERKYEKMVTEMKETIQKKQRIIDNKKKMNLLLVDLAKIKKGEVQCIETLQYTNSANLKETLNKLRDNEKDLLSKLAEISSNPDNTDSEDEEDDEEEESSDYDEQD